MLPPAVAVVRCGSLVGYCGLAMGMGRTHIVAAGRGIHGCVWVDRWGPLSNDCDRLIRRFPCCVHMCARHRRERELENTQGDAGQGP